MDDYLTARQVSVKVKASVQTLRSWRRRGYGPAYVQPPGTRRVLYRSDDVDAWLAAARHEPVAQ